MSNKRNFAEEIMLRNRVYKDKVALLSENESITYNELESKVRQRASWLIEYGIKKGDIVSLSLLDQVDSMITMLSIILVGGIVASTNARSKIEKIQYQAEFVGSKLVIAEPFVAEKLTDLTVLTRDQVIKLSSGYPEWYGETITDANDGIYMMWTSGTSSNNTRAILQKHVNAIEQNEFFSTQTLKLTNKDKVYTAAKLSYGFGLVIVSYALWAGAQFLFDPGLVIPSRVRNNINSYQPTVFFAVPVVYSQLLDDAQVKTNALCISAGDRLPQQLIDRWEQHTGTKIHNSIGCSETSATFLYNPKGTTALGLPVPSWNVRLVDAGGNVLPDNEVGFLEINSEYQPIGYFKNPELSKQVFTEWLRNGDVCYRDSEGMYHHMGRAGDTIKVNGQYINPVEIEDALRACPGVEQAVVISKENQDGIHHLEAFIVLQLGQHIDTATLRAWMNNRFEHYACPRSFHFITEIPRTENGKIQRFKLRETINA